ncbi:huntingtin-like isoform X2 [Eriocheir sinensis]|uniref:huntingtin-like isoform X2 n=1 Tax=Eriocheir sinensis TaxID=95602 RepID=UPI0021C8E2DD|nr:huntingtin-like isoform X2 [Eriocheir sinensis]
MAAYEKLVRALEAVKFTQGNSSTGATFPPAAALGGLVGVEQQQQRPLGPKASFATSLTQQGQGLLSKKDQILSSKEKAATCSVIADALVSAKPTEIQKLLSVGIETLLLLTADADPDVRTNANESLNRVIRSLSETQLGKIQVELYKEIKKNGSVRSLRAALTRFAALCHHIRPQKGRAYVQNLLPYVTRMARRTEEPLLETLAAALEKIMPTLGHFTNDNEIKNLLKAFLPNLSHTSSAVRRSAVTSLLVLCCHSRKPPMFLSWLLTTILQTLVPVHDDAPTGQVLGCLLCLRALVPHLARLCPPTLPSDQQGQPTSHLHQGEHTVSYDQVLQVYELCLHYSSNPDHNIITASLETLQALLQQPPTALLLTLTAPEGISRSRIKADPRASMLSSRVSSQVSVAASLFEDEGAVTDFGVGSERVSMDMDTPDGKIDIEESTQVEEDSTVDGGGDEGGGGGGEGGEGRCAEGEEDELSEDVNDLYSSIEIGQISDTSLLLGRVEMNLSGSEKPGTSWEKRKHPPRMAAFAQNKSQDEKQVSFDKANGSIGTFLDEDLPVKYLVRYLTSSFLLSGHLGSLVPDRTVRVSVKVLALNCVGLAGVVMPSILAQPLFLDAVGEVELLQHVDDILRFHSHADPQIGASVGIVIGQFIRASLVHGCGQYNDFSRPSLTLSSLLEILCKLLGHDSSVTSRGAITGLGLCVDELLHSLHASVILSVLPHLINVASNPYWLVKVELCDLLSGLPLSFTDHVESCGNTSTPGSFVPLPPADRFSHRMLTAVLVPLLADQDPRVRIAAASACVKLVPEIMSSSALIHKAASTLAHSGHLREEKEDPARSPGPHHHWDCRSLPSPPVPPFHCLFSDGRGQLAFSSEHQGQGLQSVHSQHTEDSLSRLIYAFTTHLMTSNNKFLVLGCVEALAQLSERYPPALHSAAWGCNIPHSQSSESTNTHIGLITLVLSLAGESTIAGDLSVQQNILTIASNILAGIAVSVLRSKKESAGAKTPWSFLGAPQLTSVAEAVVQHILRVLCIYSHVLEDIVPGTRPSLAPLAPPAAISPIKRRSRAETSGDKNRQQSPSGGDKPETEEKDRRPGRSGSIGSFAHMPEYIKMYDVLKNAHTNYKMSLEESTTEKVCGLLRVALSSLGRLLEVASMVEFGKLADEVLQYLKAVTTLLPTLTVQCGQQLLKCLFGSNVMALCEQLSRKGSSETLSRGGAEGGNAGVRMEEPSLHHLCFNLPLTQLEKDLSDLSGERQDGESVSTFSLTHRKSSSNLFKTLGRGNDKTSLSSYIRLFEPLVIKALKLYTVSSDVTMQRSVLQLLIHLVQIRVNYCLLDSDQIFIGYVIKQFEYIEEGQIKQAEELIPSMFRFLVLLSYERHHSKSIIGVPKIIQLCDGLMASGQPPLSHCILALQPLVEDLFLVRSSTSTADQRELDAQREVLCSMLLRLAHYHQVLQLISLVLGATRETNGDRWRKLSRQVIDTLLPFMSKLQVNLDSEESLSAVEEVMNGVCASVYRPVDCVLKALFTSPCELETTVGVERWVGGVLLLLRALITHSTSELVLARLEELGLSMDYIHTDTLPDSSSASGATSTTTTTTTTAPAPVAPQPQGPPRPASLPLPCIESLPNFRDPLNVTQPETQPQVAMARFLLEVVRVSVSEIRSVRLALLSSGLGSEGAGQHSPDMLVHLSHHLVLTLLHLTLSNQWREVIISLKDICSREVELMEEISEALLFVSGWYPPLTLLWCKLLTSLDLTSQHLWTRVLRTCQRKSVTSVSSPVVSEATGPSSCLSLEFMRRCGLLVFSEFVVRHMQEGEWLTWLVVQHISDVVLLHTEPPVHTLLQSIHSSPAASALLIQAIHARCDYVHKAEYGGHIISLVSGVHISQSGALVIFIVERLLASPYLAVTRAACALATRRLQLLLAMSPGQVASQLPLEDTTKIISFLKNHKLVKRYGHLYGLLERLVGQVHGISVGSGSDASLTSPPHHTTAPSATRLDLSWYLQLVRNRCQHGEGGGLECGQLLSHLEYSEIINVMSGKSFNTALLTHTLRLGLTSTLQANRDWGECNSSVETGDSEECSSGSGQGEAPLYTASKVILLQHLARVAASLPRPHHTFTPGGGNKYSERVCKLLAGEDGIGSVVDTLAPAVVEYLGGMTRLPWGAQVLPEHSEHILRFALLAMEYLHWQVWLGSVSIEVASLCLSCVDAVLRCSTLAGLLGLSDRTSYVCSVVAALHAATSHLVKPRALPSLPAPLMQCLNGGESSLLVACRRLMQLVVFLEGGNLRHLPPCVAQPIRGITMGVGRVPALNSVVRVAPDVWALGWTPQFTGEHSTSLPPVPVDLLQETDVLKQFIFRMELFGWIGRQQFEETWMALLSVLNATPSESTPPAELPFINLSLSLAVRGITALLIQTLLLPVPGNPHSGHLLSLPRDKPPSYLTSKAGHKLQEIMSRLHDKLREVQHLTRGGPQQTPPYHLGQASVEYLVTALNSHAEPPDSPDTYLHTGCYEFEIREQQLASCGLDVQSCLHFLHYLYSSWLRPQSGLCASVVAEVVKSVSCLCDLFCSAAHHRWVLESLIPLHTLHPIEDHITQQYIILATCKALATLRLAKQEVSSSLSEGVVHIVEGGLKSGQVSVRSCAVQGLLYLLQGPPEDSPPLIILAANYILKYNDGKSRECESHEVGVWEVWVYLVEHYETLPDPTLPSTALHMALTTAASLTTTPRLLHQVLRGVERLVLVQQLSSNTVEVISKLVMDLVLNGTPSTSIAALPLFITALYANVRNNAALEPGVSQDSNASDPETLLLVMEKLSVFFDRIRVGYPHEAGVVAGLLGPCLLDILPASQILNKVITEYISSHQPHPHLLASTLFQVFEGAIGESGEGLVQEWVLLSLSNFTQRSPVSLAVWCLTCFFIAASSNRWLRAAFPSVQARLGKLDARDIQIFCLAASHFRQSLATEEQKVKFEAVFQAVATPGSPFQELLDCIKD